MGLATADHASLERLAPVVHRTVRAMLGADTELTDVMHDAYVRIMEGLAGVREHEHLDRWAARVTINTVYNVLRRRRYRRFSSWDPLTEPDVLVCHTDFEASNVAGHVLRLLHRMPVSERTMLELRWFHGATAEDLAQRLDCSTRTAKRRMKRALKRFEFHVRSDAEVLSWLEGYLVPSKRDETSAPRGVAVSL